MRPSPRCRAEFAGSLSAGFHQARRERGAGFCTFNGLAIAARAALATGAESVLIVDLDAHCGGGTWSLIADDSRISQLDVSVDGYDSYQPSARTMLDLVRSADEYLPTIIRRFETLTANGPSFNLCLYNSGMDPYQACEIGGLAGIDAKILADRERIVFEWCNKMNVPIAFVLAGGYVGGSLSQSRLIDLHRLTLCAAVDSS